MIRRAFIAACATAAVTLGGCTGFTPLYAKGGAEALSRIDINVADGRTGYLLREQLNDQLARNEALPAAYRLEAALAESRDPRGLGADNTASRYEMRLIVDYRLTEIASGREMTNGRQEVLITYEAVDPPYAGIAAQSDSQERAAAEAARRIRVDLAAYFARLSG